MCNLITSFLRKSLLFTAMLTAGYAAPLMDEPVSELRLKSGQVLINAVAKNFTSTTVFVKHAGGASSVKYEDFPDEFTSAISTRRPAPPTAAMLADREARLAVLKKAEDEQRARNIAAVKRREEQVAEESARRAKNGASDAELEERKTKYLKDDLWIKIQETNSDTLVVDFINHSDFSVSWSERDVIGLTRTGTTCNVIRVIPTNQSDNAFETKTVPPKAKKTYLITFDRPDGGWPKDMIWKR